VSYYIYILSYLRFKINDQAHSYFIYILFYFISFVNKNLNKENTNLRKRERKKKRGRKREREREKLTYSKSYVCVNYFNYPFLWKKVTIEK